MYDLRVLQKSKGDNKLPARYTGQGETKEKQKGARGADWVKRCREANQKVF
jgi:hypothetical protein